MRIFRLVASAVALIFVLFSHNSAFAAEETSADQTPGSFFSKIESIATAVGSKLKSQVPEKMKAKGLEFAQKMVTPALGIGGALALLYLLFETIKFFGNSGSSNYINVLFDVIVPAMIAAFLIKNFGTFVEKGTGLLDVFSNVAGTATPVDNIVAFYKSILTMLGNSMKAAFTNLKDVSALGIDGVQVTKILLALVDMLFVVIFVFLILGVVFSSLADAVGLILMGPFLFAVGIAFGPVMISGMVTPWTRAYFTTWVQFIIATAVLTGVVAIIFTIAQSLFLSLDFQSFVTDDLPVAVHLGVAAIMISAVNSLISQAPAIASAIVPGNLGASSSDNGSIKQMGKGLQENVKQGVKDGVKIARSAIAKLAPLDKGK